MKQILLKNSKYEILGSGGWENFEGLLITKKENIKVIFYQAELDSNQAKAYAEEVGGKTEQLEPLAADYIVNLKKING